MKRNLAIFVTVLLVTVLFASSGAPAIVAAQALAESSAPVELTIMSLNDQTFEEREGIKLLQEITGVKLNFISVVRDTRQEKFQLMVSSNTLPDIIIEINQYADASEIYRLGKEGVLMPLNDLIEEYGQNILSVWDTDPKYREISTAPDGNIYALPNYFYGLSQEVRTSLFIETNFLKNLGMEMPTTLDEFYEFLKAVKENDANGNGVVDDEIPLMGWEVDVNGSALRSAIMGAFTKFSVGDNRVVNDGKVAFMPTTDEYREGLRYFRKLYEEGLFYSEAFSIDRNTIWTLAENDPDVNTLAVVPGLHGNAVCSAASMRWLDYEVIPPFKLEDGTYGRVPQNPGENIQLKVALSSNCANPEAAMKIFDYVATEDGMKLAFWGVEGYDYTAADPGAVDSNGDPAAYRPFTKEELGEDHLVGTISNNWNTYQTPYVYSTQFDPELGYQNQSQKFTSRYFENLYTPFLLDAKEYWPTTIYFDGDALEELALLQTDLKNAVKMAEAEFVMGVKSIDTDWDAYLANLESYGLSRFLQISQEQYDLNMK